MRTLLAIGLLTFVLAGCASNSSSSADTSGAFSFSGNGSGTQETTRDCGTGVNFSGTITATGGNVRIVVKDSSGATKHDMTYQPGSVAGQQATLTGAGGFWRMTAMRADTFAGSYSLSITCRA